MTLLNHLRDFFLTQKKQPRYWIAFSGGLDSHVLLSLCHSLRAELNLDFQVIHVNHHISPHANQWALHCQKICAALDMPYHEENIFLENVSGASLEELARKKRYHCLANYLQANDVLLTAHHQDDQAETFLLQLCRGAGTKGLSAMPAIKPFAKGWQARPLLNFSRGELLSVAQEKNLIWIEDESNQNKNFSRNFMRHNVIPVLQSHWPSVNQAITRSALHCAESQLLLEELAQELCEQVKGSKPNTLSVKKILQLMQAKQNLVIRTWIKERGYPLPSTKKMLAIKNNLLAAAWDKLPSLSWGNIVLRKHRDDIFLLPQSAKLDQSITLAWDLKQNLVLPHGFLTSQPLLGKGLSCDVQDLVVRFRQGGEKVDMPSRGGRHALKKLFQEWDVLPWERDYVPLIFAAEKLIAVTGFFLNEHFAAKKNEWGKEIIFQPF